MDSVLFESLISSICVALNCYLFIHLSFHMLNANSTPTLGALSSSSNFAISRK